MKTKLIELLKDTFEYTRGTCIDFDEAAEINADHLLDNGVILPTVRYGQTVYAICDLDDEITIEEYSVEGIGYFENAFHVYHCGEWFEVGSDLCILSKKQAEKALERSKS